MLLFCSYEHRLYYNVKRAQKTYDKKEKAVTPLHISLFKLRTALMEP